MKETGIGGVYHAEPEMGSNAAPRTRAWPNTPKRSYLQTFLGTGKEGRAAG